MIPRTRKSSNFTIHPCDSDERTTANRARIGCGTILLKSYQMETTRLSTKGQIVLPKAVQCASRAWRPGTEFSVEETGDGVLLRPARAFPEAELDMVAGLLRSNRKSKTLARMDAGEARREVIRRHDRGRWLSTVVVRLLTGDDPKQSSAARSLFAAGPIWIAKTVLLETSWVLKSVYGFDDGAIRDALAQLLGLRNVHTEDKPSIAAALALTAHGIELADAIHLTNRPPGATFVSFDQSFVRRANRAGATEVSGVS